GPSVAHARGGREVDRGEPRIDERRPGIVLPIEPELPVAHADLRTHGEHVLRKDQGRREGDERDHPRREDRLRYGCLFSCCGHGPASYLRAAAGRPPRTATAVGAGTDVAPSCCAFPPNWPSRDRPRTTSGSPTA